MTNAATVFLGDSLTAGGPWAELLPRVPNVLNHGVSGDTTRDLLARLDEVIEGHPRHVLLLIGTNDLLRGESPDSTRARIEQIVARLRTGSPATVLTLQTVPPVNHTLDPGLAGFTASATALNHQLGELATRLGLRLVDLAGALSDGTGQLVAGLSSDGLHLLPAGYRVWVDRLRRDVPELAG